MRFAKIKHSNSNTNAKYPKKSPYCKPIFMFLLCAMFYTILFKLLMEQTSFTTNKLALTQNNKVQTQDDIKRILIVGYGHSGSTYIQLFFQEVLFGSFDTFKLFEPVHVKRLSFLRSQYNNHSMADPQTLELINLFNCSFYNYTKRENQPRTDSSSHQSCSSADVLIYKTIHYHRVDSYQYLWKYYPNLIIIQLIRNPITHIPSIVRMPHHRDNWTFHINALCHKQFEDLKYLVAEKKTAIDFVSPLLNMWKMETFFVNIKPNAFNETVRNLYSMFVDHGNEVVNDDMMQLFIDRNDKIADPAQTHSRHVHPHPADIPNGKQRKRIQARCKDILQFLEYNISFPKHSD